LELFCTQVVIAVGLTSEWDSVHANCPKSLADLLPRDWGQLWPNRS